MSSLIIIKGKQHSEILSCSVQFSSVTQSCPCLCDRMHCGMPGFPVHHQLLELALTHAHWWCHWWCHPTKSINSLALSFLWRRQWQPTPVLLPGKSHGQRSLVGCSPWGHCKLDTTEWLLSHFSLSCIGEGNGNPLQCSYLENTRDGGAWWAAIYAVARSWTRLKWLSSSSSSSSTWNQLNKSHRLTMGRQLDLSEEVSRLDDPLVSCETSDKVLHLLPRIPGCSRD